MRRRRPLLGLVVSLTALLLAVSVLLLVFVRIPRVVAVPGHLVGAEGGRFAGTLSDRGRATVRPGQRATIRLDAWPWQQHGAMAGRVDAVAETRGSDGYAVEIVCDRGSAPGVLADGMRGSARISLEESVALGRLLFDRVAGGAEP